ncbi:MAG: hypothetical protein ACREN0_00105, partial [Thermodesulfobacteriota bacterium]
SALDQMYEKAKDHEDPNKTVGALKWALQFLEHMEHLKGLHRGPNLNPPAGQPGDGDVIDIQEPV